MPFTTSRRRKADKRLLVCIAIATLAACDPGFEDTGSGGNGGGDGGGGGGNDNSSSVFIGPGPMWRLTLDDDDDFDLDVRSRPDGDLLNDIAGRVERFSSGFARLQVNNVVGQGGPTTNARLSALPVSDELLFVQDWQTAARLLPLVPSDECPESLVAANWIEWLTPQGELATSEDLGFFGNAVFDPEGEEVAIAEAFALTDDFPEQDVSEALSTGSCNDGIARDEQRNTFYGNNGLVMLHQNVGGTNERLWLGVPESRLEGSDLDGEYVGVWTDHRQTGNDAIWYVTLSCANSGDCVAQRISDISNLNSIANQTFRLELDSESLDKPADGFITGIVEETDQNNLTYSGNIACTASEDFNDTGDKVLACVGQSPQNNQATVNGFFVAED